MRNEEWRKNTDEFYWINSLWKAAACCPPSFVHRGLETGWRGLPSTSWATLPARRQAPRIPCMIFQKGLLKKKQIKFVPIAFLSREKTQNKRFCFFPNGVCDHHRTVVVGVLQIQRTKQLMMPFTEVKHQDQWRISFSSIVSMKNLHEFFPKKFLKNQFDSNEFFLFSFNTFMHLRIVVIAKQPIWKWWSFGNLLIVVVLFPFPVD